MKAMKDRSINPHRFILLVNGFSKASQLSMNLPKGKIPYILENKHDRYENEDSKKQTNKQTWLYVELLFIPTV